MNLVDQAADLGVHEDGEAAQLFPVDADAGRFHAGEHAGERKLDGVVKLAQTARVHFRAELFVQLEHGIGLLLGR